MKKKTQRLILNCILGFISVLIMYEVTTYFQTEILLNRQEDNFKIKMETAQANLESSYDEAEQNTYSYDRFSQAKADVLAYYYECNPDKMEKTRSIEKQWGLSKILIFDQNNNLVNATATNRAYLQSNPTLVEAKHTTDVITIGALRYYHSEINDDYWILAGRNSTTYYNNQRDIKKVSNYLQRMKVGEDGYIIALNKNTGEIFYDKNQANIGKTITKAGFDEKLKKAGYKGWIENNGVSYYCKTKDVGHDYIFATVIPKAELEASNSRVIFLTVLLFAFIIILSISYIYFIHVERGKRDKPLDDPKEYFHISKNYYINKIAAGKAGHILFIAIIGIFMLTFYLQTLSSLSYQSSHSDIKLSDVKTVLSQNNDKLTDLTETYNKEYTSRLENISDLIKRDPRFINDDQLGELATRAQVQYLYVFNEQGHVIATNSVYKGFTLSDDKSSDSYEFWSVVKGYQTSLVQEAIQDNTVTHGYIQYLGVERKDAKGMIEAAISPERLKNRIQACELNNVLQSIAVENNGFLFTVDEKDNTIAYNQDSTVIGLKASQYGLKKECLVEGYSGYQTINSQKCYVTNTEYEGNLIFIAVPMASITSGRILLAVVTTIVCFFILILLLVLSLIESEKDIFKERQEIKEEETKSIMFELNDNAGKTRLVQSAVSRWDGTKDIPWMEKTAEQKLKRVAFLVTGILCILLVAYITKSSQTYDPHDIISYIIHRKWPKVPSVFSFTYIVFVLVEVMIISTIVRKIISLVTNNMGARVETVARLLNNFIKYIVVIGSVFYCLSFLGINSSALLASAGIFTLVIGFGAQTLVNDIISGIFIVFEGEFRVGDIVTIGDWRGTVLEIGIRSTKIEDAGLNIKIISNSSISGVINMTKKYSYVSCDVGIDYGESLERVEAILKDELPLLKEKIPAIQDGPFYKGVVALADSSIVLKISAQCKESDRFQLARDLNRAIVLLFDKHDINIPFPQIVINEAKPHEKATLEEKIKSEQFVKEQRELAKRRSDEEEEEDDDQDDSK